MLDSIQQQVLQLLPARRKTGQNGWTSFNAPCCVHNGETSDTRGRGGVKTNAGQVSYHCFNCGYTTSFIPGRHLTFKFRKLLAWLGADDLTIRRLVINAVRLRELVAPEELERVPEEEIKYEARALPEQARNVIELASFYSIGDYNNVPAELLAAIEYVNRRGIDLKKYNFYWTPEEAYNLHRRIVIPYYYQSEIVGYTARAIADGVKPKYWSNYPTDFVFNLDQQQPDWKFVIVCEGPFDAISIDGVAVNGSEISETQVEQIDRLQREVIVVADADRAGQKLVDRAMEAGWTVSFPVWQETCKDINEAVITYGKLFVLKSILDAKQTSKLKIELYRKKYAKN
jgi:5S rRNA maturation endonuclease (ribonuclease M5)